MSLSPSGTAIPVGVARFAAGAEPVCLGRRDNLGSVTIETRTAMGLLAVENLLAALSGQRPRCRLNPEALDR